MLYSEQMKEICEKLGVNPADCKDGLYSTLLQTISDACDGGGGSGGGEEEWFNDGNTHIWITLPEGRTSPMVGLGVNGTVTVDWGDGSEPDVLTGTSTSTIIYTPVHEYAKPGDYVVTLSGGEICFSGDSSGNPYLLAASADSTNKMNVLYICSIKKVELGSAVKSIEKNAFYSCYSLASVHIPDSVKSISGNVFNNCYSLASVRIPESVTSIGTNAFYNCYSLKSANILAGVTSIGGYLFRECRSLASVHIPDSVKSISGNAFSNCYSLKSVNIPDGVTSIGTNAFGGCRSLASVRIPSGVTSIGSGTFGYCYGVAHYDFSQHAAVPTLSNIDAFSGIPSDCEIRVPAALVDEWKAATNWSTYADYIVGV